MKLYNTFDNVIKSLGMKVLTHPLFYNSKVSIRFNIGDDNGNEVYIYESENKFTVNPQYVSACLLRARRIYNSLSTQPDILVIDAFLDEGETVEAFVNDVISAIDLPQPKEIENGPFFEEDEESTHVFLLWELNEFNPEKLLREIVLADLGGNNFLTSSVYFICSDDKVMFHLYDDRGADLCAEKTESILHIYNNLNDLILEYDRERINSIFKAE